ncbi:glutathione hydrolase 1 proenzyme-like [Danio aesculapii]|uniref:glutathione hydrolase 1 proenzyme-like n=1 Tax=Danio aesculapii TaxID=1142201 RepID=UPI0024C043C2|nr:glutathione hydrolase 1 proenzyme-like [Danio aesculapii]
MYGTLEFEIEDPVNRRIHHQKISLDRLKCLIRPLILVTGIIITVGFFVFLILPETCDVTFTTATVKPTVTLTGNCYPKAAVAADAGNCSIIGKDILKRGGSAVDAAIAALLCLSVINPQSMGIGGGVVFTIYNESNGRVETIDARETAPKKATENMFDNDPQKGNPGLLIAVPGELRGYEMAHKRYGILPWEELFEPSIKLASDGFKIGKALAKAIKNEQKRIRKNAALCKVFCYSSSKHLKENDTIRFPKLAETYRKITKEKADAFYHGSLTEDIVHKITSAGGIITREDLEDYEPVLTEPALYFTVGNYTFHAPTAPFGGPVLALILKILLGNGTKDSPGFNLSSKSVSTIENMTLTYHRMIEAFHFANFQKGKLADPRYEDVTELVKNMTSDSFADHIRSKIKDDIKQTSYDDQEAVDEGGSHEEVDDQGTSHISVFAEDGSVVAVTSSINDYFGSGVMSNTTGILFNDQMSDFIDMKNKHNRIIPGKRPLSSMCPTIIFHKDDSRQVRMVVGAEGATKITTSVAQVILNYLIFGYDLKKAVDQPRVHISQDQTHVDDNFNTDVIDGLKQRGHVVCNNFEDSVVQAIGREENKICAESDFRKFGKPAGY